MSNCGCNIQTFNEHRSRWAPRTGANTVQGPGAAAFWFQSGALTTLTIPRRYGRDCNRVNDYSGSGCQRHKTEFGEEKKTEKKKEELKKQLKYLLTIFQVFQQIRKPIENFNFIITNKKSFPSYESRFFLQLSCALYFLTFFFA